MSKQHKIKWRESDNKELARVVKNFNAKLARIEKKNPEYSKYLPKFSKTVYDEDIGEDIIVFTNRLTVNQLKELINTRQDFNREINALKRFSRRGAEEIVEIPGTDNNIKTTKWQRTEMRRRLVNINKIRKERQEQIEKTVVEDNGEETGYTVGQLGMGNQDALQFKPIEISFPSMSQRDVNWKFRTILNESQSDYFNERDEALRDNYIWSLQANYHGSDINDVIDKIQSMDIKDFLKTFYKNPGIFEWSYHTTIEDYENYNDKIRSIWKIEGIREDIPNYDEI